MHSKEPHTIVAQCYLANDDTSTGSTLLYQTLNIRENTNKKSKRIIVIKITQM